MKSKTAIVSAWVGPRPNIMARVMGNHLTYSRLHRYDYVFFDETTVGAQKSLVQGAGDYHWIKPDAIRLALADYEFVFWTDLDSVFHQMDLSLADIASLDRDLVFTGDHNDMFNGGHLFFRKSDFTMRLIDDWQQFQGIPFPDLGGASQQGPTGYVGDQIAMNVLLAGGRPTPLEVEKRGRDLFNLTNGWAGNTGRVHSDFSRNWAPTRTRNLKRTRSLLSPELRPHVDLVVQHRLNAYPWWGPKKTKNKHGPIIHFVSPYKDLLEGYFS